VSVLPVVTSAFALGLMGSLHCAGMCGPLAAAGCARRGAGGAAGYFAGRLAAYATIGALVAQLGEHAFCILPVRATHVAAVVLTAAPAAVRGLSLLRRKRAPDLVTLRRKPRSALLASLAKLLPRGGLGLGLATGILPCGLLLGAFAMAAATASPALGAASMAAFALGSAPGLALAAVGPGLAARLSIRLSPRVEGLLWCALAVWLGVRLALGEGGCHLPAAGA
jgi:sulfite exporter TauE/SafE